MSSGGSGSYLTPQTPTDYAQQATYPYELIRGKFAVLGPVRISGRVTVDGKVVYNIVDGRIEIMSCSITNFDQFTRIEIYASAIYTARKYGYGVVLSSLRDLITAIPVDRIEREAVELEWKKDYERLYLLQSDDELIVQIKEMYMSNKEDAFKAAVVDDFIVKFAVLETLARDSGINISNFLGMAYIIDGHTFGTPAPLLIGFPRKLYTGEVQALVVYPREGVATGNELYMQLMYISEMLSEIIRTNYQYISEKIRQVKERLGLRDVVTKSLFETLRRLVGGGTAKV